jgi:hypothetical protein
MLKNKGPGLVLMALGAALVLLRHSQAASRFENVPAMRIMTVNATHVAFDDRVVLREIELALNVQMTLKTRLGVSAGIDNELSPTAGTDVFTAGTVAGFTAALPGQGRIFRIQTRVGTGGKFPNNRRMTIGAGAVTDKVSARNFQGNCHGRRG